jgi:hypothetical protein
MTVDGDGSSFPQENNKRENTESNNDAGTRTRLSISKLFYWLSDIFYNIKKHGGYFVQNGAEALIAAQDETIAVLKKRLRTLDEDNRNLREQLHQLIGKAIDQ